MIAGGILAQSIVDRLPARQLLVTLDLLRAGAPVLLVMFPTFPTAVVVSVMLGLGTASFSPLSKDLSYTPPFSAPWIPSRLPRMPEYWRASSVLERLRHHQPDDHDDDEAAATTHEFK